MAEQYRRWSPYNYGVNNPLRFIDPDGNGIFDVIDGAVVGDATDLGLGNIGTVPNTVGGMLLRAVVGNMVSDPADFNQGLTGADAAMQAASGAMEITGAGMTADGLATAAASSELLVTTLGSTAEVTGPASAGVGAAIATSTTMNMAGGYNYGREKVTETSSSRKEAKDSRPNPKPIDKGQKQVTHQTKNKSGKEKMKTDGGSQTPHFHDANHSNQNKPNVHYRTTKKIKP